MQYKGFEITMPDGEGVVAIRASEDNEMTYIFRSTLKELEQAIDTFCAKNDK